VQQLGITSQSALLVLWLLCQLLLSSCNNSFC